MISPLSTEEIADKLIGRPQWRYEPDNKCLTRELKFKDFTQAFAFMTEVAKLADAQDHHPDWSNVYNKVKIQLSTHDAGGVSERDFKLAADIDKLVS
jgi:4a-hydroxytetrahydrobiopterin dehydratase